MSRACALMLAVGLLAGCTQTTDPKVSEGTSGYVSTFWATTVDGRRIPCVSWKNSNAGGLSCDWSLR